MTDTLTTTERAIAHIEDYGDYGARRLRELREVFETMTDAEIEKFMVDMLEFPFFTA